MLDDWILEANLKPFLTFASALADYRFDDLDWDAICEGIRRTDVDAQQWFDYPLAGSQTIAVALAADRHSSVVCVRVQAREETLSALGAAVDLMQEYRLSREPRP